MFRRLFAPLAALVLLGACSTGGGTRPDPNDATVSVVYGYIDMKEAPSDVNWVLVRFYDGGGFGYHGEVKEGMFYHLVEDLGPYQVESFGAYPSFLDNTSYTYDFGGSGRNTSAIRISEPGAYFMGMHRYVEVETGWFEVSKFEIEPARQPGEREILAWVLWDMETNDSEYVHQIDMVRRRLAELN